MRLINVNTLELEEFFERKIPAYAILSHTWDEEEVTYDDWLQPERAKLKKGYSKIMNTCQIVATLHDLKYVWIDTCCIDKRSSADLSEAINSMYKWYENSQLCLAYLADVSCCGPQAVDVDFRSHFPFSKLNEGRLRMTPSVVPLSEAEEQQFILSRWFTRGWTLQELLAPRQLIFLSHDWRVLGQQSDLVPAIYQATSIPSRILYKLDTLRNYSVATRMSWASMRMTSRLEDTAYCLMGIFGINMPLLYGEGSRAFQRLQEEILKSTTDHSILAWQSESMDDVVDDDDETSNEDSDEDAEDDNYDETYVYKHLVVGFPHPVFAPSPREFRHCSTVYPIPKLDRKLAHHTMTSSGLQVRLPFFETILPGVLLMDLECKAGPGEDSKDVYLFVEGHSTTGHARICRVDLDNFDPSKIWRLAPRRYLLQQQRVKPLYLAYDLEEWKIRYREWRARRSYEEHIFPDSNEPRGKQVFIIFGGHLRLSMGTLIGVSSRSGSWRAIPMPNNSRPIIRLYEAGDSLESQICVLRFNMPTRKRPLWITIIYCPEYKYCTGKHGCQCPNHAWMAFAFDGDEKHFDGFADISRFVQAPASYSEVVELALWPTFPDWRSVKSWLPMGSAILMLWAVFTADGDVVEEG
ncbi:hypothetical protein G7046_g1412 [Stylonectria norvegica]|nr:hypothetical protein G7046_g1412 [Stylonectria norvegica]